MLVSSLKERLSSTWDYIQALELVDPMGPELDRYATDGVWETFKDLCNRRGIDFHKCQEQIIQMRANEPNLGAQDRSMILASLRGYLEERHRTFVTMSIPSPTPEYDKFCAVVFSKIPLTSAFVESLFSKKSYVQDKTRNRLEDVTMSAILHVHDSVLPDPQKCLPSSIKLKVSVPNQFLDKLKMEKRIDTRVCDEFDGVRWHGEVSSVEFHEVHAQFMYRVVYEDGDQQDY